MPAAHTASAADNTYFIFEKSDNDCYKKIHKSDGGDEKQGVYAVQYAAVPRYEFAGILDAVATF